MKIKQVELVIHPGHWYLVPVWAERQGNWTGTWMCLTTVVRLDTAPDGVGNAVVHYVRKSSPVV